MIKITYQQLKQFCPNGRDDVLRAIERHQDVLADAGILESNTRFCHWVGQMAHESSGLRNLKENLNYSAKRLRQVWPRRFNQANSYLYARNPQRLANKVYGGRMGNNRAGDGWRYIGRGLTHITGKYNYQREAEALGIDLMREPELLEQPEWALKSAVNYWSRKRLNTYADENNIERVTYRINGGHNGLADRRTWLKRAQRVWGEADTNAKPINKNLLSEGARGAQVTGLQTRLKELGYGVGGIDGIFGKATARAVVAFKQDWLSEHGERLEPDEGVGPLMQAALNEAQPVQYDENRTETDAKTLAQAGSITIKKAGHAKGVAGSVVAVGVGAGSLDVSGALQQTTAIGETLSTWQSALQNIIGFGNFAISHLMWVLVIGGAGAVYFWSKSIINARVNDHQSGKNLAR